MAFKFIDLFAGLGGFHLALAGLGGQCSFACEIDTVLQETYLSNFSIRPEGDIRKINPIDVPQHQVLAAGFPCQPFSKAGGQLGTKCPKWGDLFQYVLAILKEQRPDYFLLENVPNLLRHDGGKTWQVMKQELEECGYAGNVEARILSPHWFGIPQIRERAYIVGAKQGLEHFSWPVGNRAAATSIKSFLDINPEDAKPITSQIVDVLDIWQEFISRFPDDEELPSFPIWGMEFGATYPFEDTTPFAMSDRSLARYQGILGVELSDYSPRERRNFLPSYALSEELEFPEWKKKFIRQNRDLYQRHKSWIDPWLMKLVSLPSSHQKLEWNCKGGERDVWHYVIQFRASGVRIKRPTSSPSLIAMTTTQVPIIGWERRYLTPRECARVQCLGDLNFLPQAPTRAYKALGNAVNSDVVRMIAEKLISPLITKSSHNLHDRKNVLKKPGRILEEECLIQ